MSVLTMKTYTANLSDGKTFQIKAINPDYALEAAEQQVKGKDVRVRSVARVVPVGQR